MTNAKAVATVQWCFDFLSFGVDVYVNRGEIHFISGGRTGLGATKVSIDRGQCPSDALAQPGQAIPYRCSEAPAQGRAVDGEATSCGTMTLSPRQLARVSPWAQRTCPSNIIRLASRSRRSSRTTRSSSRGLQTVLDAVPLTPLLAQSIPMARRRTARTMLARWSSPRPTCSGNCRSAATLTCSPRAASSTIV